MEFKKDGCAYTVACDNKEQCDLLDEFLDDMRYSYRPVYVFIPKDDTIDDGGYGEYFNSIEDADKALRRAVVCDIKNNISERDTIHHTTYVFYKMPYDTWEYHVNSNDDVRKHGTKVKEIRYTTKIKAKETYF